MRERPGEHRRLTVAEIPRQHRGSHRNRGDHSQPGRHVERGLAAYGDKDWTTAIREFREGYAIDPRPDFLFAWAQASRLSGDCARAIELYDQFVATGPAPEQRDAATKMSERCRESVAAEKPAEPPAPAAPAAPAAPTT
jgi:hypothetical protein